MPLSPDEKQRFDRLIFLATEAAKDSESEPALGPTFLASLLRGFAKLRDRVDDLEARVAKLEPPPPPG